MINIRKLLLTVIISFVLFIACQQKKDSTEIRKDSEWYRQPMRIAALQCNFEKDNLEVIDKWIDLGFNVEQLFHPMADDYSAIYKPDEHKKILTEYVKKAHEKNLKIILYLNIHILGPTVAHNKEIWSQRKKDGFISYLYKTYPSICLNSPWRDHFFTVLDSLKNIDIDGLFLDGPVIANGGCYCEHCKAKYARMFNGVPGTDSREQWEFNAFTRDEFLQKAYDYWKKDNPDKVFYMNLSVGHTRGSFIKIGNALKYNDILGSEGGFMFYEPAKNAFLWRPSFTSKLIESIAPEKPRVIFMAADHKPWSWWMHSPLETKLCIASVVANDANIWYGLHGSTKLLSTASADAAKEVLGFYKKNEELLINTKSAAEVGLLYSFANATKEKSDFVSPKEERESRGDTEDAIRGYYSLLTESQIPFDIISDFKLTNKKLANYKVIILPNVLALDENTENAIKEFVKNGGLLIAELGASLYNSEGENNNDFSLSDLFGISASGEYSEHENFNYFVFSSATKLDKNIKSPMIPLPLLSLNINVNDDTEIICKAIEDLPGRYVPLPEPKDAFVTSHKFGNGKTIYFAGNIGEMYNEYHVQEYKTFVNNIISEKIEETILFENTPTHLEVVLRKQDDKIILHLINYQTGPTRPFEKVTTISNLKIKVPMAWNISKISSKSMKKTLDSSKKKNVIEFILPEMNEYDILVLE